MVVYVGRDETTGKKKYKWYSGFKTKKEAEKALAELVNQIEKQEFVEDKNVTIGEFINEWFEIHCKKLTPKTQESYQKMLRFYVLPYLNDIELATLKPLTIAKFYNTLKEQGISNTTLNYVHRLLREIYNFAVKWQYVTKNPFDNVETPKKDRKEMQVWNLDEIRKAEEVFRDTPIFAHVMLALYTGMRLGEVCGLKWDDIDFKNKVCAVRRVAEYINGEVVIKEKPKTDKSLRIVALTDNLVEILKEEKKRQLENKLKFGQNYDTTYDGFISVWEDGRFKVPDYVSKKFSKILSKQNEIKKIRFHDLRHTHATLLLQAGVNMKVISDRLGHSQISITMDLYSHVNLDMQREAIEKLEQRLAKD
nr:tyrosine-type recombinase/integrase [Caldicellulosiruptor owensensis]